MKADFIGETLSDELIMAVKSLVRHSTHPLSAALFMNLPGDDYLEVENFKEIPGLGITGEINGIKINIGSKKFITGKEDQEKGLKNRSICLFQRSYFRILSTRKSIQKRLKRGHLKSVERL